MRINSISQIPVFDGCRVVGILSEDGLAKNLIEKNKQKKMRDMPVSITMESPPPVVDISTPAKALVPLVRFAKCVLVGERGDVIGIITVTDTLKMVE